MTAALVQRVKERKAGHSVAGVMATERMAAQASTADPALFVDVLYVLYPQGWVGRCRRQEGGMP
jgi:hypothetical protein